jgi:hypothetical protein
MRQDPDMDFTFTARLWRWKDDSAWHFISLPQEVADEIEDAAVHRGGFGSVRVEAGVGASTWSTSVFPDKSRETFILPIKKQIRAQERISDGDEISVRIRITQ